MNVGRNEKCPCGSGLKFKKCCMNQPLPTDVVLTLGGRCVKKEQVVSPLCWQVDNGIKIVGTAFFVGNDGLFVTAKHNVDEFADGVWDKPGDGPVLYQIGENKQFHPRPIMELRKHPTADVAVGLTFMSFHKQTGAVLAAPALPISLETPPVGSMVNTIAFPGSYFVLKDGQASLVFQPDFGVGKVQSIFGAAGRCESRPGRGFQSTLHLKSGASGGPVFDYRGRVVGVVSSGLDPQPPYPAVGFVQSIEEIMPLSLECLRIDGEEAIPTIGDLAARNMLVSNFDFRRN